MNKTIITVSREFGSGGGPLTIEMLLTVLPDYLQEVSYD